MAERPISYKREVWYRRAGIVLSLLFAAIVFAAMEFVTEFILDSLGVSERLESWYAVFLFTSLGAFAFALSAFMKIFLPWEPNDFLYYRKIFYVGLAGWCGALCVAAFFYWLEFPRLGEIFALALFSIPFMFVVVVGDK